ncbi:MAG: carbohydrate kinase [Acidobacteriota bacterium]|nr:carbohydrate kinase [Acidobacteriota bacterium]
MSDLVLAIDLGTGGPKVALVEETGSVLDYEAHRVATVLDERGAATQDAVEWWDLVRAAAARLTGAHPRGRVVGVAVTGQYASTVPVDANGVPTGPCLTWLDTRGGPHARAAVGGPIQGYHPRKALRFIRVNGGAPSTSGADPVGQILYLIRDEPELVARTRWFLEPVDYLTMRLTGVASATHASRLALWMTDNRNLAHLDYDAGLLGLAGLDATKLPPLLAFGDVVGRVTSDVAAELGLSRDALVVTGMPDLHAAAIGAGATAPYATHLALSTTSWVSCPVPTKKTDALHSIATVPGLSNDSYLVINNQETGAGALDWLRRLLGASDYETLTRIAATSPPGARGVRFRPWLAGERSPAEDKSVRASFANLSLATDASDLVRAVLEGVAANSAWLFGHVEAFTKRRLEPVRLLGGGAQSDLWAQIYADTLNRRIERVEDPLVAQVRGAAMLAWSRVRARPLEEFVATPAVTVFEPVLPDVYRELVAELPRTFRAQSRANRRAKRGARSA